VTTLGQFAALPPGHVSDRFGADAAICHKVARAESGELPGVRDRSIERRLRVARGEDPDLGSDPPPYQPGFFGGASAADTRAALSFARVQERLGIDAVLIGRLQGGRDPAGQAVLVPWGSPEAQAAGPGGAPWPGRLPPPSPTHVLRPPRRAEVVDGAGRAVEVSGRGLLTVGMDRLSVDGGPWQQVISWAGPWPVTERWWSARRRRARLQVVTADGVAWLLCTERAQWWVEALYD
jgi:protein ImuB